MSSRLAIAPEQPLLMPGMRLGKYQLIKRLAVGGMAEIYLARATGTEGFQKLVALKRILPQHAANEEFITMFLNEARLVATLHHPNIAQTYDIGTDGGSWFFTMEYVHGEEVRQMLRTAPRRGRAIPHEHAVTIVLGICAGLHHAHDKVGPDGTPLGIVHRDVSPSNVIVTYDGGVKIVDFGIAKATTLRVDTRVGTLKGKIAYMSPEQCRGERLDRRSDIFAIGILLYELTVGQRLFKGENEFAILNQIVGEDVPAPRKIKPDYPEGLERIVLKALRRRRDQRYATAQEMQLDLEAFAHERRLPISTVALARYMEELFGKKADPWTELAGEAAALPVDMLPLAPKPAASHSHSAHAIEGPDRHADTVADPVTVRRPSRQTASVLLAGEMPGSYPAWPRRRRVGLLALGGVAAALVAAVVMLTARAARPVAATVPAGSSPGAAPAPSAAAPAPSAAAPDHPSPVVPAVPPVIATPVHTEAETQRIEVTPPADNPPKTMGATPPATPRKRKKKRANAGVQLPKRPVDLDSLFPPE